MYGLCYRGVLTMREDNKLEIIKRMNRRNIITILVCILLIVLLISFFSKKGDGKVKTQIKTTLDSIVEKSDLETANITYNVIAKKCKNCGSENPNYATFCVNCGNEL